MQHHHFAKLLTFLLGLVTIVLTKPQYIVKMCHYSQRYHNFLVFISQLPNNNFQLGISLADVAAECFVNKFHLSHVFTEAFGISVGQYIQDKKIEMSKTYLEETELPIAEISERCGFNDINYFDRIFKKLVGVTPLKYRKSYANTDSI